MPPAKMKQKKRAVLGYKHEDLLSALEEMKKGESASAVSKKFQIPRSTLIYKFTGKTPLDRRMGPPPLLGDKVEKMLLNWVKALAVRGFPITKTDLLTSVAQICQEMDMTQVFPNGKPGNKWLSLFLQRHPEISERTVEKLSSVRANVDETFIRKWFKDVKDYLDQEGLLSVLADERRVFNLDESAFFLCPKGDKVLGIRGQKNVYDVHSGSEKENLTVLVNANAAGEVAPTMVVYPGQRLPNGLRLDFPDDWALSKSESGWMNGEVFFEYFANIFYKWVKDQGISLPIVVFLDGHKSHITYHLSTFCSDHRIVLITLPPNCTHIIQPLDVCLFKPLKSRWVKAVHQWRMENDANKLTKYNFAPMLKIVLKESTQKDTLKNGFKRCGLCPFDPDAVDYSKTDICNLTVEKAMLKKSSATDSVPGTSLTHHGTPLSTVVTEKHSEHGSIHCLQFFERFMSQETLIKFKEMYDKATPIWDENSSAHDLFVAWKKAKDFLNDSNVPLPSANIQNDAANTANNSKTCNEALAMVLSPETNGSDVPSPFKRLPWPGTPTKQKRTGKVRRNLLPPVISGEEWQKQEKERRDKKLLEEEQKAERKRKREEKKKEKSGKSKKKAGDNKVIFDEDDDWVCKVCNQRYSAELIIKKRRRWIECDNCSGTYHYKCIPKKHLDTFGLEESDEDDVDEVAFICHTCAKDVNSDEDNDPFYVSESD